MGNVVLLTPDRYQHPTKRSLWQQIQMHLWQTHGANLYTCGINEPTTGDWLRGLDFTGAIVWNGYGPDAAVENVDYCERVTGRPVVRVEQGWLPQQNHVYLSVGLGATSTLSLEIQSRRWDVDWGLYHGWLNPRLAPLPRPDLPSNYILVCGQVPGDSNLVSSSCPVDQVVATVRASTSLPVVYRPHPKHPVLSEVPGVINVYPGTSLPAQLQHAHAVVAATSTCLIEAAAIGTPAVSLGLGVWTEQMIRHATPLTLRHVLAGIRDGWDEDARDYGCAVLVQQAQVNANRPRWSARNKELLKGLV